LPAGDGPGRAAGRDRVAGQLALYADILPVIEGIRAAGVASANGIARALNERGGRWRTVQAQRVLERTG
jgi:hypothetical protein